MPDQTCSLGDAQSRVERVLREQHPDWVNDHGECLPCVPYQLALAATSPIAPNETPLPATHHA